MSNILDGLDFDQLGKEVGDLIVASVKDVVDGAADDIVAFGHGIATNTITVLQMPEGPDKAALLAELGAQAKLLAEQNRIRVNNESWKVVESIVNTATSVAVVVLRNAADVAL